MKFQPHHLVILMVTSPLILGFIESCVNFKSHNSVLNNIITFNNNSNCPQQFTIYAANNTGELYAVKIFKEECETVYIDRQYTTSNFERKTHRYKDVICEYKFVRQVVSFPWSKSNSSQTTVILSPHDNLYKTTSDCNGVVLQKILTEKNIATDEIDPGGKYEMQYYKISKEMHNVVYYGIEGCGSNNKTIVTCLSNNPKIIAEEIYPIVNTLKGGIIVSLLLSVPILHAFALAN